MNEVGLGCPPEFRVGRPVAGSVTELLAGLRAAAEPTRLRLLVLCAHAELTVSELTQILGQSQPRVSRHLKLMCDAGLLDRFREGTWVFYRLAQRGPRDPISRRACSSSCLPAIRCRSISSGSKR